MAVVATSSFTVAVRRRRSQRITQTMETTTRRTPAEQRDADIDRLVIATLATRAIASAVLDRAGGDVVDAAVDLLKYGLCFGLWPGGERPPDSELLELAKTRVEASKFPDDPAEAKAAVRDTPWTASGEYTATYGGKPMTDAEASAVDQMFPGGVLSGVEVRFEPGSAPPTVRAGATCVVTFYLEDL
jgi:hypothetical protein